MDRVNDMEEDLFQPKPKPHVIASLVISLVGFIFLLPLIFDKSGFPTKFGLGRYSFRYALVLYSLVLLNILGTAFLIFKSLKWVRAPKGIPPAKKAAFAIILFLVFLIIFETAFRWVTDKYYNPQNMLMRYGNKPSPYLVYEHYPNTDWRFMGIDYKTDNAGFRKGAAEMPAPLTEDVARIAMVGGSSVFGYGLTDDKNWPSLLHKSMNKKNRKWEIINAGNNSHNSFQVLIRTYKSVLPHKPDAVIFYENYNDREQREAVFNFTFNIESVFHAKWSQFTAKRYKNRSWYLRNLVFLHFMGVKLENMLRDEAGLQKLLIGQTGEPDNEQFSTNLLMLKDLCRQKGIIFVVMTFIHAREFDSPGAVGMRRRNVILRDMAKKYNLPIIDLEKSFESIENRKTYFLEDQYHPNRRGAKFIADKVEEFLSERHNELISNRRGRS